MAENFNNRHANLLALYRDSRKTRDELMEAYRTAKRENNPDFADALADILDEKYPGWDVTTSIPKGRGTHITLGNQSKFFVASKQAYIWLVEQMLSTKPQMGIDNFVLKEMFIEGSNGARHLALSPAELFPSKKGQVLDPNTYHKLSNGWFLNTKPIKEQKIAKLVSLAAVCELPCEWSWDADGEIDDSLDSFDEILKGMGILDTPG